MLSSAHVPEDKRSPLLALGILSISFLMSVSNAVSGTIPLMEKYFSDVSRANVELLIVIPTGGVLLGTVKVYGHRRPDDFHDLRHHPGVYFQLPCHFNFPGNVWRGDGGFHAAQCVLHHGSVP